MAKQEINLGTTPNDRTGDKLRVAFDKINDNFTELYATEANAADRIVAGENQALVLAEDGTINPPSIETVGGQTEVQGVALAHGQAMRVFATSDADAEVKEAPTLGLIGGKGYATGGGSDVRVYGGDGGLRSEEFGATQLEVSITPTMPNAGVISGEVYTGNSSFITLGMRLTVGESYTSIMSISEGEGVLLTFSDDIFQSEDTVDAIISDPDGGAYRGWGGTVRIYGGDGRGGGYVRLYGGDSNTVLGDDDEDAEAGYVRLRGGYSQYGRGGNVEIEAGDSGASDPSNNGQIQMRTSRGTVNFGGWPEVGPTAPSHWHITKDDSYIDLFFGDDFNYFKLPSGGAGAEIKTSNLNVEGQPEYIWGFGIDGKITLPGPEVHEVTSPDPGTPNNGVATAIAVSNSPNVNWTNATGVMANGIIFTVAFDESGNATVNSIQDGGTGHWEGESFGPVPGDAFGGTSPADDMYFTVTAIQGEILAPIDVNKSLQRLSGSQYSLADGVEGQIMYFVNATNNPTNDTWILVANGRAGQNQFTDAWFAPFYNDSGAVTAIFTEGAWNFSSGQWD